MFRTLAITAAIAMALAALFVKHVYVEGDHVGFLVIAPVPSLQFQYGGGEEGQWRRTNPGAAEPWWLAGRYVRLTEWW